DRRARAAPPAALELPATTSGGSATAGRADRPVAGADAPLQAGGGGAATPVVADRYQPSDQPLARPRRDSAGDRAVADDRAEPAGLCDLPSGADRPGRGRERRGWRTALAPRHRRRDPGWHGA